MWFIHCSPPQRHAYNYYITVIKLTKCACPPSSVNSNSALRIIASENMSTSACACCFFKSKIWKTDISSSSVLSPFRANTLLLSVGRGSLVSANDALMYAHNLMLSTQAFVKRGRERSWLSCCAASEHWDPWNITITHPQGVFMTTRRVRGCSADIRI